LFRPHQAFAASGLAKPYFSLEATTLYSLFTYHALPHSLGSALNQSTSHTLLETMYPLANGDGTPLVVEGNGADALKVVSPVEANVKLDSLDEGSSTDTLSGLDLYEVDQVSSGSGMGYTDVGGLELTPQTALFLDHHPAGRSPYRPRPIREQHLDLGQTIRTRPLRLGAQ
jgi:hypothetical protein